MRTRAIQPGDLVMVNKRGRVFHARVLATGALGRLSVEPLDRCISWRQASARGMVDHLRHARADRGERAPDGQLSPEGVGER